MLPQRFVVLEDRGDAGAVLLDTTSEPGLVLWVDSHAVEKVAQGSLNRWESEYFKEFGDWVEYCVQEARDAP
jgi:hypothetical protein